MDRNRTVAGLDVHKDSVYLCIMGHDEASRVQQQMQHYEIFLKKHNLGVSNCSFSLGLLLSLY